uniref:Uncharacterized protein n=1 Tax=Anguilla anguilla TaxID=7936 RepID=A0A0E9TEQ2_ANGAN
MAATGTGPLVFVDDGTD